MTRSALIGFLLLALLGAPRPARAHDDAAPPKRLGTVAFANSCAPEAQESFERGVALLHSFACPYRASASTRGHHPFSLRSSMPAAQSCAMRMLGWRTGLKRYFLLACRRLAKSDAFAAGPALFDEFNASSFKSMSYRRFVSERNWNFPVYHLDAADRCDPNLGRGGQIEGCPPQHRPELHAFEHSRFFSPSAVLI